MGSKRVGHDWVTFTFLYIYIYPSSLNGQLFHILATVKNVVVNIRVYISFKHLFLYYFWLPWVSVAVHGLSLVWVSRGCPSCGARTSHCGGFSCCAALAVGAQTSVVGSPQAREHVSFRSCGTQALLPSSRWKLPGPGIEPMFHALPGRLLTTGPPGKSIDIVLNSCLCILWINTQTWDSWVAVW